MNIIFVNITPRECRVAVFYDGELQEVFVERSVARGLVGNVYLGRVVRVLPGMQSAFVDIGLERTGFLHVADLFEAHLEDGETKPIENVLHEGQALMVQVAKDPIGTKGARLTTTISLAGRKLVYLPRDPHIGVSQRIEDEAMREHLKELLTSIRPETEKGGYIIRTSAEEGATAEEFEQDMAYLCRLWKEIRASRETKPAPSLLYQDLSLAQRVLRDMVHQTTEAIEIDDEKSYAELVEFAERFVPDVRGHLKLYKGERPLFELHGIEEEIARALKLPGTPMIGINNRNLRTFETSIRQTLELKRLIPQDRLFVTESGILSRQDVHCLREAGVGAFLVGEAFMRESSPGAALQHLFGDF